MMHDVFLSHSSKDKEIANAICESLESQEIDCWIAPRDIPMGVERFEEEIVEAIEGAKVFVVIISSDSNESSHVAREVAQEAKKKNPNIIPVRIEEVNMSRTLDYYLSSTQRIDATTPPLQDHLETLTSRIRQLISPEPAPTEPERGVPSKLETAMLLFKNDSRTLLIPKRRITIGRNRESTIVLRFLPRSKENDRGSLDISRNHMKLEVTSKGLLVEDRGPDKEGKQTKALRISDVVVGNGEHHLVNFDQIDGSLSLELPDRLNCDQPFKFNVDLFGCADDDIKSRKTTAARKWQLLPRSLGLQRTPQLWDLVKQNGIEAVRLRRRGNLEEEQYVLMFRETLIGSSQASCPICLDDDSLAPVAARLLWLDRSFWLQNLGTPENVQVNGRPVGAGEIIPLREGMKLQFGKTTVRFERARQMHL